jgi:hypothetical protein
LDVGPSPTLVTILSKQLSLDFRFEFNFNRFKEFAALPSRVVVVCRIALPNPASCHEIVPREAGTKETGPRNSIAIGMNKGLGHGEK